VETVDKFAGYTKSPFLMIHAATGRAEMALAGTREKECLGVMGWLSRKGSSLEEMDSVSAGILSLFFLLFLAFVLGNLSFGER
jgi:hypothetical protein